MRDQIISALNVFKAMTLAAWLRLFVYDAPKPVKAFAFKTALSLRTIKYEDKSKVTTKIASEAIALVEWLRVNHDIDGEVMIEDIQCRIVDEMPREKVRGSMCEDYLITVGVALREVGTA